MKDFVRQEVFQSCSTVIVKVGTNVLTDAADRLDPQRIRDLGEQLARLRQTGRRVVLVTSGAVGAGMELLGLPERPRSLPELQAAAAVGQPLLIRTWSEALAVHGLQSAQLLLTGNDFRNRQRYLNVRNTLRTLFDYGAIPIVNENDTVSIEEIALGDNDQLASMLATLVHAPLLVILSSIDGLFDGPPDAEGTQVIPIVERPDESLLRFASARQSSRGRGGMGSKLKAILAATGMGETVILANGRQPGVLDLVREGEQTGTLFLPHSGVVPAWKRWLASGAPPAGSLVLDAGAVRAVQEQGRSLLAVGIQQVNGEFEAGALVRLLTLDNHEVARGLANYSAEDLQRIKGRRSEQIAETLGHVPFGEVIHRDNLSLTRP